MLPPMAGTPAHIPSLGSRVRGGEYDDQVRDKPRPNAGEKRIAIYTLVDSKHRRAVKRMLAVWRQQLALITQYGEAKSFRNQPG